MKLETFFEKFDQFADTPNAVAKMRGLVLDLAVRGRLFGKAVEDEADGLPTGWHQRHLGEVAQFINGDRSKNYPSKSFRVDDGVPFINAGHLSKGDVDLTDMDYITPEHFDRLGGGKIEPGDVLYCLRGSLGKCAVVQSIKRGAIASSLLIIRPSQQVASRFIYLFLTSPLGARMIAKYDNGSAQPNLSAANVKKYIVPLPPLAEQKRIVAKVDELMALCDRLEAQQEERETRHAALARASLARFADAPTPANLHFLFHSSFSIQPSDLRKSILTLAVQGKLVPQDPNDEPAEELLEKVRKARRALAENGDVKTKVQLAPIGPDEEPYSIPDTWLWVPLNELTELVYGKLLPTTELLPEGFQVFGANGIIGRFSKYLYEDEMLLISCRGAYSGTPNISPPKCYVTNNSIVCEFFEPSACDIRFFHSVISISPREKIVTGSAQPQVTVANAIKLPVPLPPLAEQRRIVAKVEQLMALVDALETQLAASRATAANLLSALVAELTGPAS